MLGRPGESRGDIVLPGRPCRPPVHLHQTLVHPHRPCGEVHVVPREGEQFGPAQSVEHGEPQRRRPPVLRDRSEEEVDLVLGPGVGVLLATGLLHRLRQTDACGRGPADEPVLHGVDERRPEPARHPPSPDGRPGSRRIDTSAIPKRALCSAPGEPQGSPRRRQGRLTATTPMRSGRPLRAAAASLGRADPDGGPGPPWGS